MEVICVAALFFKKNKAARQFFFFLLPRHKATNIKIARSTGKLLLVLAQAAAAQGLLANLCRKKLPPLQSCCWSRPRAVAGKLPLTATAAAELDGKLLLAQAAAAHSC